ncbi:MAG: potassium channel protein [Acidobacteria bacterium]|nr:potassium channel protein [Acidobacteriota bacterium]
MPIRIRIYLLLAALAALIVGGTVGYRLLEGWSWFDGLYMTVITLATIGYGEVHPLTTAGRAFTLVLIVFGVAVFGFVISTLTQSLIESEFANRFGRRKVFKSIDQLKQHYILCGAGKVGMRIIEEMKRKAVDFVVIERDEDVAEKLLTQGHLVLIGDATDETVLQGARVEHALALITAASSDPENVYISLTARGMNPNLYIVSRATDLYAEKQLVRAGANRVISPTIIASHRMAQAALSPAVADFIELTTMTESLDLSFEQILISAGSRLDGVKLKDSSIRSEHNAIIVSITPQEGAMVFNPDGEYQLKAGDLLIAIGTHAGMSQLAKIAGA